MKAIALVCLMLLTPVVASDSECLVTEQYHKRIQEVQQQTDKLEQDIFSTLQAKPELLTFVREQIEAIYNESNLPKLFLTELDSFLRELKYPEELLSDGQRINLTCSPNLQDLEPIDRAIGKIEKSIQQYQNVVAVAEDLEREAKETLLHQDEWSLFIEDIIQKINKNTLTNRDLSKIYEWSMFFYNHMKNIEITRGHLDHMPFLSFHQDKNYNNFIDSLSKIADFFRDRWRILWKLIKDLNVPTNYEGMASNNFIDPKNPINKFLKDTPEDMEIYLNDDNLNKSILSIPVARDICTERLRNAFRQPDLWQREIKACQARITLLMNAKRIIEPLKQAVSFYRCFKTTYLENLDNCCDILTHKARLVIPGRPLATIPQSFARNASSLSSNGPFCVEFPSYNKETIVSYIRFIGSLAFETRKRELLPHHVGAEYTQYVFETLFDIPSDPVTFIACDNILAYAPRDPSRVPQWNNMEDIIKSPHDWIQEKMVKFMTVRRSHIGGLLSDVIHKVEEGRGTFEQFLDPESFGEYILFSLLTQACLTPGRLGLVRKGNKFGPKRIGFDSFLQPLFQLVNDQKHQLIGYNILYFLPFMSDKIPDCVKKKFLLNDVHLILSGALLRLTNLQNHYNDLIEQYKLTNLDDFGQSIKRNITQARSLGLVLGGRIGTIEGMIERFNRIKETLASPGCTYEFIQKNISPLEFQCYQYILTNARKKTETTPIFFYKVMPSIMGQLRMICEQALYQGEIPWYTSEDLDLFDKGVELYLTKIKKYLEKRESFHKKKANNDHALKVLQSKQSKILETATRACSEADAQEEELNKLRKKAEKINACLDDISKDLLPESLFEKLGVKVDTRTQDFLQKKHAWAVRNHIFDASILLKAWNSMFNIEKPIICEDFLHSSNWTDVPMLLHPNLPPMFGQLIESNYPISSMAKDYISHVNLSDKPLEVQIEIMDSLLQIISSPQHPHKSWGDLFNLCKKQFLAIPPTVQSYFQNRGLSLDEEKLVLQDAQMQCLKGYKKCINSVISQPSSKPFQQWATHLLRQFWMVPLEGGPKDDPFLDLLLLPLYSLNEKDQSHERWIELYKSSQPLSGEMRRALLSHASPLLYIKWLHALKLLAPHIEFDTRSMKVLFEKADGLQKLLSTRLSFTFPEIISTLWPEIDASIKQELEDIKHGARVILRTRLQKPDHPSLVEHQMDLWKLDRAATEWLSFFDPDQYGKEILASVLETACEFKIDVSKINHTHWRHPQILRDLAYPGAQTDPIQLAASLRVGFPWGKGGISLIQKGFSFKISGIKGNMKILCDIILLFPEMIELNLSKNMIHSVKPLMPTLLTLTRLKTLNLSYNPLHNLSDLFHLSQLQGLVLNNTSIHVDKYTLQSIIFPDQKEKVLPNRIIYANHSGEIEKREVWLSTTNTAGLQLELAKIVLKDPKPDNIDKMICILERLSEQHWDDALALPIIELPWDHLFDLLKRYDPRESARKLLFAFKFKLPSGTDPNKISFVDNLPTTEAEGLTCLSISGAPVQINLLSSLVHFKNLTKLWLCEISLTTLKNIPSLINLKFLDVRNNQISSLKTLHTIDNRGRKFPSLQVFIFKNNQLTSNPEACLEFLLELPLIALDLSGNLLSTLPDLGTIFNKLQRLDLSGNDIPLTLLENYENTKIHTYLPQRNSINSRLK